MRPGGAKRERSKIDSIGLPFRFDYNSSMPIPTFFFFSSLFFVPFFFVFLFPSLLRLFPLLLPIPYQLRCLPSLFAMLSTVDPSAHVGSL